MHSLVKKRSLIQNRSQNTNQDTNQNKRVRQRQGIWPTSEKIKNFILSNPNLETPFLVVDLDIVEQQYRQLMQALPFVVCY